MAKRLDKILAKFFSDLQNDFARASYRSVTTDRSYSDAREKIISLFMECVPVNATNSEQGDGWNACRTETLKKMEELRK